MGDLLWFEINKRVVSGVKDQTQPLTPLDTPFVE
jgi:hypothetical protein